MKVRVRLQTIVVAQLTFVMLAVDAGKPIYSIDCNTVTESELRQFEKVVTFNAMFPGQLHGFCAFFDVVFGPEIVVLSTSPSHRPTHWAQSQFYFEEPLCEVRSA